ncbi:MAG: hypothetical protein ACYS30_22465 [Planctomycetota bacterium]
MAKPDSRIPNRRKHYFFLNLYEDAAFTRCPKCDHKTFVRKFPLVIHVEPRQILLLNKKCRYCTKCDLIITRKSEIESMMATAFEGKRPEIIGNDYLVMGTLDRSHWRQRENIGEDSEIIELMYVFKDVLNFKPVPAWTM